MIRKLACALALLAALTGCVSRSELPPESKPVVSAAEPVAEPSNPERPEPELKPEVPDYSDPAVVLRTFFTPYGNLIYMENGWSGYEEIGPDSLFQFAVQARYHWYMSKTSYAELFGADAEPLPIPEPPEGQEWPPAYPADVIEQAALEYFGAPATYLRTAMSYHADGNYYQFQGGGLGEEWAPRVFSTERDGDILTIDFEAWYKGGTFYDSDGKPMEDADRKIYNGIMKVKLREDGTFQYQSVATGHEL